MASIGSGQIGGLRRGIYRTYHRDGLLDLAFGSMFLLLAVSILTDLMVFAAMANAVIFGYIFLKINVTGPRAGFVKFHNLTKGALPFIVAVMSVIVGGLMISFLFPQFPDGVRSVFQSYGRILVGTALSVAFGALGFAYGLRRFYLHSAVMLLSFATVQLIGGEVWAALAVIGGFLLFSGLVVLHRFIRANPKNAEACA